MKNETSKIRKREKRISEEEKMAENTTITPEQVAWENVENTGIPSRELHAYAWAKAIAWYKSRVVAEIDRHIEWWNGMEDRADWAIDQFEKIKKGL